MVQVENHIHYKGNDHMLLIRFFFFFFMFSLIEIEFSNMCDMCCVLY